MKFSAAHTTSVTITGTPAEAGWYHGKEYIENKLKRRKATVENLKDEDDKTTDGLVITFPTVLTTDGLIPWPKGGPKIRDQILKLIGDATEHVKKMEADSHAKDKAYIDGFVHRGLSAVDPDNTLKKAYGNGKRARDKFNKNIEYLRAIHKTITELEEWAEESKQYRDDSLHAGALMDLFQGYKVWDIFLADGYKQAAVAARRQDTAVREKFEYFWELLEENGENY